MIYLDDVSLEFISGEVKTTPVNQISLTIESGEFLSIVGPSGSGKSSLLNVISGLIKPTRGEVYYSDVKLSGLSHDDLSYNRLKHIGMIFQDFRLVSNLSTFDNVTLPYYLLNGTVDQSAKTRAELLISRVGLSSRASHFPSQLSGGQQQRVAIARALMNSPSLVVADEPTGNLDTKNTNEIVSLFRELNDEGTAILIVTHDEKVASQTRRQISLADGRITQDQRC